MFLSSQFRYFVAIGISRSPRAKMKRLRWNERILDYANLYTKRMVSSTKSPDVLTNYHNGVHEFVSVSQIKQKLLKSDCVFDDGYTCLSIECVFCKSGKRLYINKVTGFFICYGCGRTGAWSQLEPLISNPSFVNGMDNIGKCQNLEAGISGWAKVIKHLQSVKDVPESERRNILQNLELEKLPWTTLDDHKVMYDDKNHDLYWPLSLAEESKMIPGYLTLSKDLSEQCYPYSSAPGFIRRQASVQTSTKSAVLVPTLRDFLALSVNSFQAVDVICLPHGQFSLPQTLLPLLEQYEKLILWFGDDVTSWNNVRLFARKLSIERCHIIRSVNETKSPFAAYKHGTDITEIVNNAKAMAHASIITFSQLRDDLLTELYSSDQASGIKWTRFPALNSILQGHRRGELTILTGPTGSGKTTFMSEYSLDLITQKVTTLWGSFEIRNQRLARTMLTQMACAPLQTNRDKFDEWADKFALLPLYFMTFHGQQPLETVMETVQHAAYVHDVAHVIIDNVQFMLGLSSTESGFLDRFYRQDALIGAFRNFATTYNCHVTLVIHPRKEREGEALSTSSIFGGAKASQEADNVLIIQNKFNQSGLKMRKYLQVAKNRFSGDLGIIPLEFDRDTLSFWAKK